MVRSRRGGTGRADVHRVHGLDVTAAGIARRQVVVDAPDLAGVIFATQEGETTDFAPVTQGVDALVQVNVSGEAIPAEALLQITGTDAGGRFQVDKPSADSLPNLLVNGPTEIATGGYGSATFGTPMPVSYDDAHTPAVGEVWGSAANSWLLTKDKSGWAVVGDPDTERTTVPAARAAGSSRFARTRSIVRHDQPAFLRSTKTTLANRKNPITEAK